MSKRVLVGYATKTGTTVSVAEKIGEVLGGRGFDVDVTPMTQVRSLIIRWVFRKFGGAGEGDCRDWNAIAGWAQELQLEPAG